MTKPESRRAAGAQPTPRKVLFVCLGNACRSPMAESIARRDAADVIEPSSAGLSPLGFVPDLTKQTLSANGYSIENLDSCAITRELWDAADMIVNMSGVPKETAFTDPQKVEDWDVQDPYGADPGLYQTIYEDIRRRVAMLAERFRNETAKSDGRAMTAHRI